MTIRVALADDHRMLRESLRGIIDAEGDLEVVGDAGDGPSALDLVLRLSPDVLVLDIRMPVMNGIEIAKRLKSLHSPVKVLALSGFDDKAFVKEMLKAGASGYVAKTATAAELTQAIRAVARGQSFLSPEVTRGLVSDLAPQSGRSAPPVSCLGQREREVLRLLAEGHRSPAIAEKLHISPATVETHRRNIMTKLGLRSVAELTKYAVREGLTTL
ncbi:MAG TPA: response regulator transcription factor [Burkholderiaceae bacterium]|nr:response regulator transcription factor [Burkholderiaceae bacterium]